MDFVKCNLEKENPMSTDLKYLAYTAMLTSALWIPYVVCQVMTNGFLKPPNYVDPTPRQVPLWGKRADRTYLTAKANAMTAFWAAGFFWLRVAHAIVYLLAVPYLRTLIFTLGFVAVAGI